jgi:hypothetical protein
MALFQIGDDLRMAFPREVIPNRKSGAVAANAAGSGPAINPSFSSTSAGIAAAGPCDAMSDGKWIAWPEPQTLSPREKRNLCAATLLPSLYQRRLF